MPTPLTNEQFEEFLSLACALSPENLTCDGELTHKQAQLRADEIMRQWYQLELEVGRHVTEVEVWEREFDRHRQPA